MRVKSRSGPSELISRTHFEGDGRPCVTHSFDSGAAWQNLALQAWLNKLVAHGMEGFDYGRARHRCEQRGNDVLFISEGPDRTELRLHSSVPLSVAGGDAVARFRLKANESASFVLEDGSQKRGCNAHDFVADASVTAGH